MKNKTIENSLQFYHFFSFKGQPAAYGSSRARGCIRATAAGLCHSHSHIRSELTAFVTYRAAKGNAG